MQGIRLWLRAEIRARWRALLSLAILLGIAGGAVIAAAAGARRTDTAYDRFLVAQDAADVVFLDDGFLELDIKPDEIAALPQVASVARGSLLYYLLTNSGGIAAVDDKLGRSINRFKILEGRAYDPRAIDEIVVGFALARRERLRVGSTFLLIDPADLAEFPPEVQERILAQNVTLKVVGIVAAPGEFPPQYAGSTASIHLTPAFFARYGNFQTEEPVGNDRGTLFIRLKRGAADVPAFLREARRLGPGQFDAFVPANEMGELTKRSFHFQAQGLWLLAAFGALAVVLIFAQSSARQVFLGSSDYPTLSALGMGRRDLVLIGLARASVVGIVAGVVAVAVAVALSPLSPFGDARIAEPTTGISFDATAIALGSLAALALSVLGSLLPAWRTARSAAKGLAAGSDARDRPSAIAAAAARAGMPAPMVAGARLALESGRGKTAVPVRSTVAGLVVGVAVLVGALTFGSSLNHLLRTPELYGVRWDTFVTNYGNGPDLRDFVDELRAVPGIDALAIGTQDSVEIGGEDAAFYAALDLRGHPTPPIAEGRAPRSADEAAVATRTLRRMKLRVGDRLELRPPFEGAKPVSFRIVGRAVVPPSGLADAAQGEGVIISLVGLERAARESGLPPGRSDVGDVFISFSPDADRAEVVRAVARFLGEGSQNPSNLLIDPETPADIVSFGGARNLPLLLGLIIGAVATSTLAHTIVSCARRRRADLAILKTLGFVRRQVRGTVAWQATILTLLAVAIGVPVGAVFGRWVWTTFADQLGMLPRARVAAFQILVLVPAALVLANLIAAIPARLAARVRPAIVLRAE